MKKYIGDLEVIGYFQNGDVWCGETGEDGFWIAYDAKNRAYETSEMPERNLIKLDLALGYVGEYVEPSTSEVKSKRGEL